MKLLECCAVSQLNCCMISCTVAHYQFCTITANKKCYQVSCCVMGSIQYIVRMLCMWVVINRFEMSKDHVTFQRLICSPPHAWHATEEINIIWSLPNPHPSAACYLSCLPSVEPLNVCCTPKFTSRASWNWLSSSNSAFCPFFCSYINTQHNNI